MAGLSDIAQVDAGQGISAFARGRGMAMQEDEAKMNFEREVTKMISQGAISSDTPEKWSQFVNIVQKRFPKADLSPFADFSARQPMVDQLRNYSSERSDDRADARSRESNSIARERLAMDKAKAAAGGGTEYGLVPIYGTDAQGNTVAMQPSKAGGVRMIEGPNGVKIMGPADKAQESAAGKARGTVEANLPVMEASSQRLLQMIDDTLSDPALSNVTGPIDKFIPTVRGDTRRAQSRVDQIQGATFLQAYNDLRGGGQITEAEGAKATAAYNRLHETGMSDADYKKALQEFRSEIVKMADVAKRRATKAAPGAGGGAGGQGGAPTRINDDSGYNALPSGAQFIGPDGKLRVKP